MRRGMLEYLVKWSGFPEEENEFITAKQLQEDMSEDAFQKVLDDFNRKTNQPSGEMPTAAAPDQRRSTRQRQRRNVR